jgi:serine/threonine protein kinase
MELVPGGSLLQLYCAFRDAGERLPHDAVRGVAQQGLAALAHLHAARCIHRDLKPAAVLVHAREGRAVLSDLGNISHLSRTYAQARRPCHALAPRLLARRVAARRVRLVRGEGRGVSTEYEGGGGACERGAPRGVGSLGARPLSAAPAPAREAGGERGRDHVLLRARAHPRRQVLVVGRHLGSPPLRAFSVSPSSPVIESPDVGQCPPPAARSVTRRGASRAQDSA